MPRANAMARHLVKGTKDLTIFGSIRLLSIIDVRAQRGLNYQRLDVTQCLGDYTLISTNGCELSTNGKERSKRDETHWRENAHVSDCCSIFLSIDSFLGISQECGNKIFTSTE